MVALILSNWDGGPKSRRLLAIMWRLYRNRSLSIAVRDTLEAADFCLELDMPKKSLSYTVKAYRLMKGWE